MYASTDAAAGAHGLATGNGALKIPAVPAMNSRTHEKSQWKEQTDLAFKGAGILGAMKGQEPCSAS